jgi:hypothetical protein
VLLSASPEKTFHVPVPDRTTDKLMAVLPDWIKPIITVISNCWLPYCDIETHGHTNKTVNHTIGFVDVPTGTHMNTNGSTCRHVKVFLNPHTRMRDIYHLAHYMISAGCLSENADQFAKFIGIVASMERSATQILDSSNVAKCLTVASPLVFIRCPQQVRSVTLIFT